MDAASAFDLKPVPVTQHRREIIDPFHHFDIIIANVASERHKTSGCECDSRNYWVDSRDEKGLIPSEIGQSSVSWPQMLEVVSRKHFGVGRC